MRWLFTLLLTQCSLFASEPPPCDPLSFGELSARCGDDEEKCHQVITERKRACAKEIKK